MIKDEQRLCTLRTLLRRLNAFESSKQVSAESKECFIANVVYEILEFVQAFHATQGRPHSRIRPWNIDFTTAGRILVESRCSDNVEEDRMYLTPERLMGFFPAGFEQDSWSIGLLMAELACGKQIFSSVDSANQLYLMFKTLGFPSRSQVRMEGNIFNSVFEFTFCWQLGYLGRGYDQLIFPPSDIKPLLLEKMDSLSPQALELLSKFLQWGIDDRIKPAEALCHPFLSKAKLSSKEDRMQLIVRYLLDLSTSSDCCPNDSVSACAEQLSGTISNDVDIASARPGQSVMSDQSLGLQKLEPVRAPCRTCVCE
mmetsp:Transcript_87126/g.232257  ORF Transcript_87126/g.232257 Transcript_87126/m.232257 type:complete len:312 (+) Transcript_87126:70-1005(+)